MEISKTAEAVYRYLEERIEEGFCPSVREICKDLNIPSTSTVHGRLAELEKLGLITRTKGTNRSIRLNSNISFSKAALVGAVAAGSPILAAQDIEQYIPVSRELGSSEELFALKVKGESMINAGIFDGDIVIVRRTPSVANGEIAVALMDGEATVKTFFRENGGFRLQPENDSMAPIFTSELSILGKVVALIRNF